MAGRTPEEVKFLQILNKKQDDATINKAPPPFVKHIPNVLYYTVTIRGGEF